MNNMYNLSVYSWSPYVGCNFDCIYCRNSFQAQLKRWGKKHCQKCYNFEPHEHPERLDQPLPPTGYMQFIFTCSMGDISFCSTVYLWQIIHRILVEPDRTFLIQSKNPKTFERIDWPDNVILGTTIESNCNYDDVSKAPSQSQRIVDFFEIKHKYKMITIEPILDFNLKVFVGCIREINPLMIWLGYDTKKTGLPEPPIEKVKELHWELSKMGIVVLLKQSFSSVEGR